MTVCFLGGFVYYVSSSASSSHDQVPDQMIFRNFYHQIPLGLRVLLSEISYEIPFLFLSAESFFE